MREYNGKQYTKFYKTHDVISFFFLAYAEENSLSTCFPCEFTITPLLYRQSAPVLPSANRQVTLPPDNRFFRR